MINLRNDEILEHIFINFIEFILNIIENMNLSLCTKKILNFYLIMLKK